MTEHNNCVVYLCHEYQPAIHILHCKVWCFPPSFSGIPGKKCGTIIVRAEELSNCRVSPIYQQLERLLH